MQALDVMSAARLHAMARLAAAGVNVVDLGAGCVRLANERGDLVLVRDVLDLKPSVIERLTT